MKKNTFTETPLLGFPRLTFPRKGLRVYARTDSKGMSFELATGIDEFVPTLESGIGIQVVEDGLRTYQVGGQPCQVLTFDPALFYFRFEEDGVTFSKHIGDGGLKTVLFIPLDAFDFFLVADYRYRVEVWWPIRSVKKR